MDKKEYRLSYAAFVYYIKQKKYKIQQPMSNLISFWFPDNDKNKTKFVELFTDRKNNDHCGYLYFNSKLDLEAIFIDIKNDTDYNDFINNLIDKCNRDDELIQGERVLSRCGVPKKERSKINIKNDDGKIIKCLHIQ